MPGFPCCCSPPTPPDVDWISCDDNDTPLNSVRSGQTSPIWAVSKTNLGGCAYAPSVTGGGVFLDDKTGTSDDGLYAFNITSGSTGAFLHNASLTTTSSAAFNECNGAICWHNGGSTLYAVDPSGSVLQTYTSYAGGLTGVCRRTGGDIWSSASSLLLLSQTGGTRLNLSGVASTSTAARWLQSSDGDTMYALGVDSTSAPTQVELFEIDAGGASATLLTNHSTRNTTETGMEGMTLIGNWLFWGVAKDRRVWQYHIPTAALSVASDLNWEDFATRFAPDGFYAPR